MRSLVASPHHAIVYSRARGLAEKKGIIVADTKLEFGFDKQCVRDYLVKLPWDMKSPPPELPPEIVKKTLEKYREALI